MENDRPRYSFWAGLLALPFAVLLIAEGALRLGGFSRGYPLFVPVESYPNFHVVNPEVGFRYFSATDRPPTVLADYFRSEKPDSLLRIIVQGGSSAAGFPFYYGGTFPHILETRLRASAPSKDVEVINVAMAAVNSFALLDQAREILRLEPDAVLIYAGHNEYFGALGTGSTEYVPGGTRVVRFYLALQRLRLVQLLKSGLHALFPGEGAERSRMEALARERFIRYGSRTYRRGIDQFRENIASLLKTYRRAGVPVYVSTIASNLRNQRPFLSDSEPDSLSADIQFDRAHRLLGRGRFRPAKAAFTRAKDLDGLRFRAPDEINSVIRELARAQGAGLVDARQNLAGDARFGIIGSDVMTDHLHPTAAGYARVADAFYEALYADDIIPGYVPYSAEHILLTRVDSLVGSYHIAELRSRWPFADSSAGPMPPSDDAVARLAWQVYTRQLPWHAANEQLISHYEMKGDSVLALQAALSRIQELPHRFGAYVPAARLYARHGRLEEAAKTLLEGLEMDEQARGHLLLADVYKAMRNTRAAQRHVRRAGVLRGLN